MFFGDRSSRVPEHLAREGYAVVDDFVRDADAAKTMRDEICSMPIDDDDDDDDDDDVEEEDGKESDDDASRRDDARLKPNRTHFTDARKNKRYLFSKPGVFEYDMHMKRSTNRERKEGSDGRGTTKTLERFFEATGKHLADAFNDAAKEVRDGVKVKPGDANRTVKLQINTGGAFPYHFDNPGGAQQNRKLTCILYLNEDYEDKCGGEIVLVPFMGPFVTIRPIFNRLVVFYSETMLHRVNKAVNFPGKGRVCLTGPARRRRRRELQKEREHPQRSRSTPRLASRRSHLLHPPNSGRATLPLSMDVPRRIRNRSPRGRIGEKVSSTC